MVFASFYAYWHRIVAGFLSPYQLMILVCYMMFRPMIPYGVVLCPLVLVFFIKLIGAKVKAPLEEGCCGWVGPQV